MWRDYEYRPHPNDTGVEIILRDSPIQAFNASVLGLGDLRTPSEQVDGVAAMFDLEGFTTFTRQVDPHFSLPNFCADFLDWLFESLRKELTDDEKRQTLFTELPFFAKFTGDGALFLWRIDMARIRATDPGRSAANWSEYVQEHVCNVVVSLFNVVTGYQSFLQRAKGKYADVPPVLRCGAARGNLYSVGECGDWVGPCINIAARLQKFHGLSFAFSARGVDPMVGMNEARRAVFEKKRAAIRGIGDNELVYVLKTDFDRLSEADRAALSDA